MMHFIISGSIRKEIRNIMSFTELKKLHWLLSNGHFSVISERALVSYFFNWYFYNVLGAYVLIIHLFINLFNFFFVEEFELDAGM